MKIAGFFRAICCVLVIFTMAVFMLSVSHNLVLRSANLYGFYFNDSKVVSKIYTNYTNNQMADLISDEMGLFNKEPFQIEEDNGYDTDELFDEAESEIMTKVRHLLNLSALSGLICFAVSVAIFTYFIKNGKKKIMSDMYKISLVLTIGLTFAQSYSVGSNTGRVWLFETIGITPLESGTLVTLLGGQFFSTLSTFLVATMLIEILAITYIVYLLTKQPRLFY